MTEGFFPLTVKKLVRETADATTLYFEIPENLKDTFTYTAGQYLTFEVEMGVRKFVVHTHCALIPVLMQCLL